MIPSVALPKAAWVRVGAVCVAMLVASVLAIEAKPTRRVSNLSSPVDLERIVPEEFSGWRVDKTIAPLTVSPDVQARLTQIYSQTLSRTYVNDRGMRVMLSIAYGGDQSDSMQVHKPEICYPSQGFEVAPSKYSTITTAFGEIPVTRLVARLGARNEPISYWIVVGDRIALRGMSQKLAQLRYGVEGKIPDGLLFRVSSIDRDSVAAFALQEEFVQGLLGAVTKDTRERLVGDLAHAGV